MRKVIGGLGVACAISIFGVLMLSAGCGRSGNKGEGAQRFGVKSCRIEYNVSGTMPGHTTVWIDDWGMREAQWATNTMRMFNRDIPVAKLTLIDAGWYYDVDLNDRTGMKMEIPNMGRMAAGALGKILSSAMGGKKIGTEQVAGRPCEVWETKNPPSKSWIWKGIPLKSEIEVMGERMITEAILIEENPVIPEGVFSLPDGVVLQDI